MSDDVFMKTVCSCLTSIFTIKLLINNKYLLNSAIFSFALCLTYLADLQTVDVIVILACEPETIS